MSEETTPQTPQEPGTDASAQTPASGTEEPTTAAAAPAPPPIDYEQKFKASQTEAMRLYQENQRLSAILATNVQKNSPQPGDPSPQSDDGIDYSSLTDALLDRDSKRIAAWQAKERQKTIQEITRSQQESAQRQGRINASMQVVAEAFKEPNSALGADSMQRYQQMLYDPSYAFVQSDTIDLPTPQGNVQINPHLMRMAVMETQSRHKGRVEAAKSKAQKEAGAFIEPVNGPAQKAATGQFNPQQHLTQAERSLCDKVHGSYKDYWDHMNPKLKDARIKAGKALTSKEAGI